MFQFPEEIDGWLSPAEGAALARYADGKDVFEIGSYCGRSTVCLAQTAKHVTSIDPHDGRATPRPQSTRPILQSNLQRYDLWQKVTLYTGTTATVLPGLTTVRNFAFIDGDHSLEAVRQDIEGVTRLLAPGSLIAFHDYRTYEGDAGGRVEYGVTRAVDELVRAGGKVIERVGSLCVVQPPAGQYTAPRKSIAVMLAMPMRPGEQVTAQAAAAFYGYPCLDRSDINLLYCQSSSSILPLTFDLLWAQALMHHDRGEITHFAMIHDDVVPGADWLRVLLGEMRTHDADIVSAVVPIKDARGLTSTGIDDTGDVWNPRRLTLTEVHERPTTFTDPAILLNTGLWVCDLSRPWVKATTPEGELVASFHQRNRIVQGGDGWKAECRSEDWEFSRLVRSAGGTRQYATRTVGLYHADPRFTNTVAWGTCKHDPNHEPSASTPAPNGQLVTVGVAS